MTHFKNFALKSQQTTKNESKNGKFPNFIIVGGQRCGTASLYNYLISNLDVTPAVKREIHFFDKSYGRGLTWYKTQFKNSLCIGESTPYYMFHPHSLRRISNDIPDVKIIILLRNPVDRAYSHYGLEIRMKKEHLSFEDAIYEEPDRLKGELDKMINNDKYYSFSHQQFSYLLRGIYISQMKNVFRYFKKNKILVICSEDFFKDPHKTLKQVSKFLKISDDYQFPFKVYNKGNNSPMNENTRERLSKYFKNYNKELYSFLGKDFGW